MPQTQSELKIKIKITFENRQCFLNYKYDRLIITVGYSMEYLGKPAGIRKFSGIS